MRKALVTGITGQDGSYLSSLLLQKGYEVHGILRRASTFNTERIDHLYRDPHDPTARMFLHYGDLTDGSSLRRILHKVQPEEVYNLGAQSHVKVSFELAEYSADVVATGTLRLLEAVRDFSSVTGHQVIRPARPKCSVRRNRPKRSAPRFIPAAPMPSARSRRIGIA